MDLASTIVSELNNYIFDMSQKISETHNIPIEEILNVWCEQQNIDCDSTFGTMLKILKKQKKVESKPSTPVCTDEAKVESPIVICDYIFNRGPSKGTQCTTKTKNGNLRCSKHKKIIK